MPAPFGGIGAFPPFVGAPPILDPFLYNGGVPLGGPLAPIRAGNFLPGAHHGIGFGLHGAAGLPLPPPPPGAVAAPFAPMAPLWTPGLAFGNVPAMGFGGVMPGMMMAPGMMLPGAAAQAAPMQARPAPALHDGNAGFPAQPAQEEITQIAGGIPPGVALVESAEHTIIIHIKGNACPWLSPGASFQVEPLALASGTGLNRLIQVCNGGITGDEECENTAVTECIELGNGLWEKGQTFRYNDAVSRVLTMKDAGWDNTRNRTGGQSLHLWGHRV